MVNGEANSDDLTGPARVLFGHAMHALDSLSGFPALHWSFGGGTAMRLVYEHRESKDIDIFLLDPTALNALSPRLNDVTEAFGTAYTEQSNYLKLRFPEGEVDFIVAAPLTGAAAYFQKRICNRFITVETPIEIVAKKCYFRADEFTARDVFDFAILLRYERNAVNRLGDVFLHRKTALINRLQAIRTNATSAAAFQSALAALAISPKFDSLRRSALDEVLAYLG